MTVFEELELEHQIVSVLPAERGILCLVLPAFGCVTIDA